MTRHRICGVGDLEVGQATRRDVDGVPVCVIRARDGYHAISDICTHEDYSLADGEVELDECEIECWKHGSMFSFVTGAPSTLPATRPVAVYEVTEEDGCVMVELP